MADNKVPTIDGLLKSGLLRKGTDEALVIKRIPVGIPAIDNLIGGGLPIGRPIQFVGPESTGKSLLAQYAVAAVQKTERPTAMYMDLERSYDKSWWEQSGVDTEKLIVSQPATAEQAIDIMRAMLQGSEDLGIIVLDSIAAMVPAPEMDPDKSSEDSRQPGTQAKVITLMWRQLLSLIDDVVFISTNQMRDSIGSHDPLAALPGGKANRHFNQIILSTRREGWINESGRRIGFHLEIGVRKNKTAPPVYDTAVVDFLFQGQIDYMGSYIEEAISQKLIVPKGPWFAYDSKNYLGKPNLRQYFSENPEEFETLKSKLA